ncbi:hypothetical protein MNBD_GAMMA11-2003 [hydrothermal vent metagenome]|uniref:Uncharacterized protein n=1 Tax=hydrothermal vent metagenome TaxID=652676 RepID=A0A3B0X8V3_9ZZZZ
MFGSSDEALEFVHEYASQVCLSLYQVESVEVINAMELTVKAVEGHIFTIPLEPLQQQIDQLQGESLTDDELLYYFGKKVNEALGYTNIWPTDIALVYPVIKSTAFIHGLSDKQAEEIIYQGYEGDLWICYGVYKEGQLHCLTHEQLKYTLGIEIENLHSIALDNLDTAQAQNAKAGPLYDPVWQMSHENHYADDAGALLHASFWQSMFEELKWPSMAMAVPHADCVLFCDADNTQAMDALQQTTEQVYHEADEPLSRFVFWWNPENLCWQTSRFVNMEQRLAETFRLSRVGLGGRAPPLKK